MGLLMLDMTSQGYKFNFLATTDNKNKPYFDQNQDKQGIYSLSGFSSFKKKFCEEYFELQHTVRIATMLLDLYLTNN